MSEATVVKPNYVARVALVVTLLALYFGFVYPWPMPAAIDADLRAINGDYDDAVETNVDVDPERQKARKVINRANSRRGLDRKAFNRRMVGFADGAAELYNGRQLALRRARKLPPPTQDFFVNGRTQRDWKAFGIEIDRDSAFWIKASGRIWSYPESPEISTPNGLYPAGQPWPDEHRYRVRAVEAFPYRALMAKLEAETGGSSDPMMVGSLGLVCGPDDDEVRLLQLWENEFLWLERVGPLQRPAGTPRQLTAFDFFGDRIGGYSFKIDEAGARDACDNRRLYPVTISATSMLTP